MFEFITSGTLEVSKPTKILEPRDGQPLESSTLFELVKHLERGGWVSEQRPRGKLAAFSHSAGTRKVWYVLPGTPTEVVQVLGERS
jgi:predicted RNA binding protein YcfA (HicA-like mRNA interferase family)